MIIGLNIEKITDTQFITENEKDKDQNQEPKKKDNEEEEDEEENSNKHDQENEELLNQTYMSSNHLVTLLLAKERDLPLPLRMFRSRLRTHIILKAIPDGMWQGWWSEPLPATTVATTLLKYISELELLSQHKALFSTEKILDKEKPKNKKEDMEKEKEKEKRTVSLACLEENPLLEIDIDQLCGEKSKKHEITAEIRFSHRRIRGAGRDHAGSFAMRGGFKREKSQTSTSPFAMFSESIRIKKNTTHEWSIGGKSNSKFLQDMASDLEGGESYLFEFEFDQVYHGKFNVKYIGLVTSDHTLIGCYRNPTTNNGGFFKLHPLAILQTEYADLRGHGPILMNPHVNVYSYTLELSNATFHQIYETIRYFLHILKTSTSLEEVVRANYALNIVLRMLKCHLEAFGMMFEKRDHQWPGDKDLLKYERMTQEEIRQHIEQEVEKKIETEKEKELEQKQEREKQNGAKEESAIASPNKENPPTLSNVAKVVEVEIPSFPGLDKIRTLLLDSILLDTSMLPQRDEVILKKEVSELLQDFSKETIQVTSGESENVKKEEKKRRNRDSIARRV